MAYRPQTAFSAGEIDPALFERTDLDKYRNGLATLRNAYVGKTGRIIGRIGTQFDSLPKLPSQPTLIFAPPYSGYLLEFGNLYVRIYNVSDASNVTFVDVVSTIATADLSNMHITPAILGYVYIAVAGSVVRRLNYMTGSFDTTNNVFLYPPSPSALGAYATTATGQAVDYAFSVIYNGQEGDYLELPNSSTSMLEPINAGENNIFSSIVLPGTASGVDPSKITGVNVYRRPSNGGVGGAYGFITSFPLKNVVDGATFTFTDYSDPTVPDYTHSPPIQIPFQPVIVAHSNPVELVTSKTAAVYQQRLLLSYDSLPEAILGSRTGLQNDFFQETTLTSDSAVLFKAGTTGIARVLRMLDSLGGLLVFTTNGIYQNTGALDYTNLALQKKSTMVIQENVPPIDLPGGASIAIDKATNSVRSLVFSYIEQSFPSEEISIFSNHLFATKQVVSWAFQEGDTPLVWMVMNDGSLVTLTYQRENQMQAWARHDTEGGLFESVTVVKDLNNVSIVYFVVNRNGIRQIEKLPPKGYDPALQDFSQDIKSYIGMDSAIVFRNDIGAEAGGATFNIVPTDIDDLTQNLVVNADFGVWENTPGSGAVGDVFRVFNSSGSNIDLTVVEYLNPNQIIVSPSIEYPSDLLGGIGTAPGTAPILFGTFSTLTGLDILEGQSVSVFSDGYVIASPNNDDQDYPTLIVTNGQITLPENMLGAIVYVGIPITTDIVTLDLDTVEQKPTKLESKIIQKVWIKVLNSIGMYVGSELPTASSVESLVNPTVRTQDPLTGNIGNAAMGPITKMYDFAIPNDWRSNGRIAIRQVDPLPLEILSITPDLSVYI